MITESAAMVLHVHDVALRARLVPSSANRQASLFNQLAVRIGAIFPTVTFGDEPKQFGLYESVVTSGS